MKKYLYFLLILGFTSLIAQEYESNVFVGSAKEESKILIDDDDEIGRDRCDTIV